MTKEEKERYADTEELREILYKALNGKKFRLDCGHHASFFHPFGNNVTIYNGKRIKIVCSECGY